jgi:hypothetical protein
MKKIIFMIIILLSITTQTATASENCQFNGNRMIVELKGGVLRYIYDNKATAYSHSNKVFKKGKLMLENMTKMNVQKRWFYKLNNNKYDFNNYSSSLIFDLTGTSGGFDNFNVYELCE